MGRGRQKAKHTKVARELKYFSPQTNYGALEQELSAGQHSDDELVDRWADQYGSDQDDVDEYDAEQDQNKSA
ncbi:MULTISPECIES: DUF3073 domain-containing protein [unclassified Curtobacterium]|uniref:DUF3073 domain-containing protein n=1 Tax=unclassified Curtobacterium TaxID=257496 RepID=UPI0008DC7DDF|nr:MULTISPECIES: DUF3073 domain-containing protein [unclassified Curtobacterium]OIH98234.1 hypothetical protein BIU92_14380 [Curtobacterium sp. MCBA15_003]OII15853.1 hypothetical protein BIU97_14425 [Curtobacterium sp. MCBA15_009]OII31259.1 hypothetical protein BIU94_04630 [Curtobacterium sp. MMLR14_006]WIE65461.1 DUF3073 domain-containing protein [Curtobacterium sp. MCLR17_036]